MTFRRIVPFLVAGLLVAGVSLAFGPKDLKKSAEKKAKEETDKAKGTTPSTGADSDASAGKGAGDADKEGSAAVDNGTVSDVSTKFDFVPGDKVILMDDYTGDELGEFPARLKLYTGNFDVVDFKGERWVRQNGADGFIGLRETSFPEKWTLEMDTWDATGAGPGMYIGCIPAASENFVWSVMLGQYGGQSAQLNGPGGVNSVAEIPGNFKGRHHVSIMASGTAVKVYVDRERVVNVPEMTYDGPPPTRFMVRMLKVGEGDAPMFTNIRFAEGGKKKVDLLATPFVTHGIYFDSGSDKLKPESAPVLRQIATYLKENAAVAVTITGHTDDVGAPEANQSLSEKRAQSVVASLSTDFGIAADRLKAAGKGESDPMAPNDSPEGKAMNRRVVVSKS